MENASARRDVLVAGWTEPRGSRPFFGSLLLVERDPRPDEIGHGTAELDALIVGIVRDGRDLDLKDPQSRLRPGDKLLVIRQSAPQSA